MAGIPGLICDCDHDAIPAACTTQINLFLHQDWKFCRGRFLCCFNFDNVNAFPAIVCVSEINVPPVDDDAAGEEMESSCVMVSNISAQAPVTD